MIFSLVLSLNFDLKKKNKLNPKKRHVEERRPEDINCGIRFLLMVHTIKFFHIKIKRFKRESKDWLLFVRTGASLFCLLSLPFLV